MTGAHPGLSVEVLDRAAAIARLPSELDGLAQRALEPNVFTEPLMFIPALQLIDVHVPIRVVCTRDANGVLLGVVALVREPLRHGFAAKILRNWVHRYCFLGTPLLDARSAPQVLEALAAWIESGAAPAGGIEWVQVSWDGPFAQLVRQTFNASRSWTVDVSTARRALLERAQGRTTPISGRHAKELRRLERRLAEHGPVEYAVMQHTDDWQPWYEEFLTVEASGWKGTEGSAIKSRTEDDEFFRRVLQRAHAGRRLQLLRLTVAGKAVAMKLNLRAGVTSYSLKIGHDDRYAQYSPGVLLELFNMKAFELERHGPRMMDSCAAPNHPMIDRLWSGRREIATVTLARRGALLRSLVRIRPWVRRLKQAMQTGSGRLEKR